MSGLQHHINRALSDEDTAAVRREGARQVKLVYGTLALVAATLAATTGIAAERLGIAQETRDTIALGFLIAAILETAGLFFWERLFPLDEAATRAD
jgi:NAD/NADP transhydrogenase alpha subunit